MSDFKRWFSYIFSYDTGGRRRNIGFAKVDAREGKCRLQICVRGIYGSDGRKLDVGIYSWGPDGPQRASVGKLYIRGGAGEYTAVTKTDNLFDSGMSLEKSGGLWLTGPQADAVHLAAWDKEELDIRDFLTQVREKPVYVSAASVSAAAESAAAGIVSADMAAAAAASMSPPQSASADGGQLQVIDVARLPEPDLWESLCRY